MVSEFDPYHEWLGIPASEQPPHHYRLLGIPAFEEIPKVIENAADQRMMLLRTFQAGKRAAESQRLLNELSAARVCLLNPQKKAAYDEWLRGTLQAQQPKMADQTGAPAAFEFLEQEQPARRTAPAKKASKPRTGIYLAAAAVAALTLIAVLWAVFPSESGRPGVAKLARQPQVPAPATPKAVEQAKPATTPIPAPVVAGKSSPDQPKPATVSETPSASPEPVGAIAETSPPGEPKPAPENPPVKPQEPALPTAAQRLVPDEAAIAKALEVARQSFREDYERAKTPAEKVALAEKLRETAGQSAGEPAERFVLLRLARDVATKAGDPKMAFAAIDEMRKAFSIDDLAMKSEALSTIAGKALKPDDYKALAGAALGLVEQAIDAESLDVAQEAMKTASRLAGRVRDRDLMQRVHAARKQLADNVKAALDVQAARATLKDKPDDPDANLALGKYLCFVRGQWPEGLNRLAAGSDEALKALAKRELAGPGAPDEQLTLADGWWDLGLTKGEGEKEGLLRHAAEWYERAKGGLTNPLLIAKIEKRLGDTWLDEMVPLQHKQGWGSLGINRSVDNNPLKIGGQTYSHGLGTHADAMTVYALGGRYRQLEAECGVDSEVGEHGTCTFEVWADGKKLFDSGVVRGGEPAKKVAVDLRGKTQLVLIVTNAGDGKNNHADWANARLLGK